MLIACGIQSDAEDTSPAGGHGAKETKDTRRTINLPFFMSEPLFRFEVREKYLFVVGLGKRDNLLQMTEAADRIVKTAKEHDRWLMLVDYRKLEIDVSLSDAFNIVRGYETNQPDLRKITVAAVFDRNENPKGWAFGQFWKEVGDQRGFHIEIFEDMDEAEKWLLTKVSS